MAALLLLGSVVRAAGHDAPPADPPLLTISPIQLAAVLRAGGQEAAVDDTGLDAVVRGTAAGLPYEILFYECDDGPFAGPATADSACLSFEYRAFAPVEAAGEDSELANGWNDVYHFGKMWRDELGEVAVQMNVVVDGGVTRSNILATHDRWRRTLSTFIEYMEQNQR